MLLCTRKSRAELAVHKLLCFSSSPTFSIVLRLTSCSWCYYMDRNDDDFLFTYFTRYFIGLVFPSRFPILFIHLFICENSLIIFICWLRLFSSFIWGMIHELGHVEDWFMPRIVWNCSNYNVLFRTHSCCNKSIKANTSELLNWNACVTRHPYIPPQHQLHCLINYISVDISRHFTEDKTCTFC
jgi:hypothetical protein